MKTTVNWLPSLVSALVVVATAFVPQMQDYMANHPAVSTIVLGLYAILTHLAPSPVADKKQDQ